MRGLIFASQISKKQLLQRHSLGSMRARLDTPLLNIFRQPPAHRAAGVKSWTFGRFAQSSASRRLSRVATPRHHGANTQFRWRKRSHVSGKLTPSAFATPANAAFSFTSKTRSVLNHIRSPGSSRATTRRSRHSQFLAPTEKGVRATINVPKAANGGEIYDAPSNMTIPL